MTWRDSLASLHVSTRDYFGDAITYTPAGLDPVAITARFRSAGVFVDLQAEVPTETIAPTLRLVLADLPATPDHGDTFETSDGKAYEVRQVQPDGTGIAILAAFEVDP